MYRSILMEPDNSVWQTRGQVGDVRAVAWRYSQSEAKQEVSRRLLALLYAGTNLFFITMGDRRRLKVVEMTLQELITRVNSLEHQTGLTKEGWPREVVQAKEEEEEEQDDQLMASQVISEEKEKEEEDSTPPKTTKGRGRKKKE